MKAIFSLLAVALCAISPLFAQAPGIQRQGTIGGNNKKFFHLSFDGKEKKCLRLGIGTLLTSDKYYPEVSLAFNESGFGVGGSVGKIFSQTPYNNSKNFGWHFSLGFFTKINLTDSKIIALRPGVKADVHILSVIDRNNKIYYTIISPFVGLDIVPLKNFGINYQVQFPVFSESEYSGSKLDYSTMLHTISIVYVISWEATHDAKKIQKNEKNLRTVRKLINFIKFLQ